MARKSFVKTSWPILVILSALAVGFRVGYGWYKLASETARGRQPEQRYAHETDSPLAFSYTDEEGPDGRASVFVGNATVMAFRSSYQGRTPQQRARDAARVISESTGEDDANVDVRVGHTDEGLPTIVLNGEVVAVVDRGTAQANDSAAEDVAIVWDENLRIALTR